MLPYPLQQLLLPSNRKEKIMALFTKTYLADAAERVIASFVGGFTAAYNPVAGLDAWTSLKVALGAGLFAALKALAAKLTGDPNSASLVDAKI